jgi:HPt (histidine-containing phosphotransfer) domain-containing protein
MDYKFINMEYLDSVSGGDPEIIKEIVIIFKDQSSEIFNEMMAHLAGKNYNSLGLLAHKAKSSVAIMGMSELAVMLKTFEIQAREGKETQMYETYITRFRNETSEAVKELENLVNTRLSGK